MSGRFSYDDIADTYAASVDSRPYNALYERPAMLAMLPPLAGARVLDAGCGPGWYAAELAARGAEVIAVDASATMIENARKRFATSSHRDLASRVDLRVADLAEPLPFIADASLDAIVSSLALHYMRDWGPALTEFRRMLKPGGWLLFSTHHPVADSLRLRRPRYLDIEEIDDYWKWLGRVRYYHRPLTAIVDALTRAGLAIAQLVEPLPTEEFRKLKPVEYERLERLPEFLIVRAIRMDGVGFEPWAAHTTAL